MEKKLKRFFFHYRKSISGMSVHFSNKCYPCKDIVCNVGVTTKYNLKQQPHLVLQGWCTEVIQEGDKIIIN